MLLAKKTTITVSQAESIIIGHMCYAASKLWNVCNYERLNYKTLDLETYPNWYYQKKAHKGDLWYKNLPAQSAQEVCKLLDKAWKSFFALKRSGGIENPRPPRFKQESMAITYMQAGIKHESGSPTIRLSLPRKLMCYLASRYAIHDNYLFLENQLFKAMENIKQIKVYPPKDQQCQMIIIYEVADTPVLEDNQHYLSIDLGIHNLMTCLNSQSGESFIVGRKYLTLCHYYHKEIVRVQSQWASCQARRGVQHPKTSKHLSKLYRKKANSIQDYLHKITKSIVDYCTSQNIHTVIIGDITGIRKNKDFGKLTNQKLHALPYAKLMMMLEYKLALKGIVMVKQKEAYTSQCSPLSPEVSKKYAVKSNRIHRGLYCDKQYSWNADCVGAYNIMRCYLAEKGHDILIQPEAIQEPYILKVAV